MEEVEILRKAYDEDAEKYFETRTKDTSFSGFQNRDIERPFILKLVPKDLKGLKLLDVGCGPGIHLKEYVSRGAECYGIDISKELLKFAKKENPSVDFKLGSAYNLEYEEENFDIVTGSFIYDHVKDIDKAFSEIKKILKPKGLFIFSIPHPTRDMFRDSRKDNFFVTNSYFDETPYNLNVACTGKKFPTHPRPLQTYFKFFVENGFVLVNFIESKPDVEWKKKYPKLDEAFYDVPQICFFKWRKE